MHSRALISLAVLACALALGAAAPAARAGDYTVALCQSGAGGFGASFANGAFAGSSHGSGKAYATCDPVWGLITEIGGGATWFPDGGYLEACAPSGTRFVGIAMDVQRHWQGSGYASAADGGSCGGYRSILGGVLSATFDTVQDWHVESAAMNDRGLRLYTICAAYPCAGNWGVTHYRDVRITVRDDAGGPARFASGGLWDASGWVRGVQPTSFQAEDNVGVRRMRIEVDPDTRGYGWPYENVRPCDYSRLVPCDGGRVGAAYDFDTNRVGDGDHVLRYAAEDSGGEWTWGDRSIHIDNTAPEATLVRDAGSLQPAVAWRVSDPAAGVDAASLRASYSRDGGRTWSAMSGAWDASLGRYTATVPPSAGSGSVHVRLSGADRAAPGGNAFTSAAATIAVDMDTPAAPSVGVPSRWLNGADPGAYFVVLSTPEPLPPSGVAGYSVTRDGAEPDGSVDVADAVRIDPLPEGTTTVRARAVSGTGVAGPVSTGALRVDRSAPVVSLRGAGTPGVPHPGPAVAVTLRARDSVSGMGDDGYVAWRVDGADAYTRADGDEARLELRGAGTHTLAYYAQDAAGNRSPVATRAIVIAPGADGAIPGGGFRDRTTNPETTFRAAARFGPPCPAEATLAANRRAQIGSGSLYETLVGFALPAAPDCTVASARLYVDPGGPGLEAQRVGSAWDEAKVSWATRPGLVGPSVAAGPGGSEWDVTALVGSMYDLGENGIALRGTAAADGTARLTIRFTEPSG